MARDLAPLVEGATIEGAWWDWPAVIRHPAPEVFERALRGRRIQRVGRRAKWLVLDLVGQQVLAGLYSRLLSGSAPSREPHSCVPEGDLTCRRSSSLTR